MAYGSVQLILLCTIILCFDRGLISRSNSELANSDLHKTLTQSWYGGGYAAHLRWISPYHGTPRSRLASLWLLKKLLPSGGAAQRETTASITDDLPLECTSLWTLNLTEFYRMNTSNTDGDLGVLDAAQTWFRVTGAAGTQVSYNCSQCATFNKHGYWTDVQMPLEIAETKQILFYQSCNKTLSNTYHGTVTRCTEERDGLVYRFDGQMRKDGIICGMK